MSAQRLYAVSVSAGEPASLHDFERDGPLRIIAARSDRPLRETDLNPGETCYVTGESEETIARDPAGGRAGRDPVTVLALIGTCVSLTLINPYSHESNVMVMQPGGYSTAQFARLGAPILAACLATACGVAYLPLSS
jgi:hypothetical protein